MNVNLFKQALRSIAEWKQQDVEVDICVFGAKASAAFRRYGIVAQKTHMGDAPKVADMIGTIKVLSLIHI